MPVYEAGFGLTALRPGPAEELVILDADATVERTSHRLAGEWAIAIGI